MIFLAPASALIAAAITAPLLLLLYFLKLRRRPVRISSTMLWESAVRDLQANAPFRWLRPSLLLLLQVLALACLLVAFARPALDSSSPPGERLILMIDCSASMSAPAEALPEGASRSDAPRPTRLDEAKRRATDLIDRLSRSSSGAPGSRPSEAMVIAFAASARAMTPFTSDRASLRRAIEAVEPTDQPDNFDEALRLVEAQTMRGGEPAAAALPRVMLFSDGALAPSDSQVRPGVGDAEFRFVQIGPPPPTAAPRDAPPDAAPSRSPLDNLAIVALSARRDYDDPSLVRVFVRIQNAAPTPLEAPLTLRLNSNAVAAKSPLVPAATRDVPGEASATFEVRTTEAGLIVVSINRPDDLASDNTAALVLEPPRSARVLVVHPTPLAPAAAVAEASLLRALEEITRSTVRATDLDAYDRSAIGRTIFSTIDLIVFDAVSPAAVPPLPSVSFGAALPIPGMALRAPAPPPAGEPAPASRFLAWRRTSPFLRDVGLDSVVIANTPVLILPSESDDDPSLRRPGAVRRSTSSDRVISFALATGPTGPLIALIDDDAIRRIVVAFPLAESTWTLEPSFVLFLANTVEQLTPLGEAASGKSFTTTEAVPIHVRAGADSVGISGPISFSARAPIDLAGPAALSIGPLSRVGVYTADGAQDRDRLLAVNLVNANESAIATRSSVDVGGISAQAAGLDDAAPLEVWHWFVLAALALLSLEWLLFAWRTRV